MQHQELEREIRDCNSMLDEISHKLDSCLVETQLQDELESKLASVKELLGSNGEVYARIQLVLEPVQSVLTKTSPDGHPPLNSSQEALQSRCSALAAKIISTTTTV